MPLLDLTHKCSVMFVSRCLQSESVLVKSVANYGVCHGRMLSGLGRNVQTCCEHFSLSTSMLLGMPPSYLSDIIPSKCLVVHLLQLSLLWFGVGCFRLLS